MVSNEVIPEQLARVRTSSREVRDRFINPAAGTAAIVGIVSGLYSRAVGQIAVAGMMDGTPGGERMERAFGVDLGSVDVSRLSQVCVESGAAAGISFLAAAGLYVLGNATRKAIEHGAVRKIRGY